MTPDLLTVIVANTALSAALALAIGVGLGRRPGGDGGLRIWLQALAVLTLIGPLTMVLPRWLSEDWIRVIAYLLYALGLGVQADAIARLGGVRLKPWMVGLPAVVLGISLLNTLDDPLTTHLLLKQVSGMLLFSLAALALFLPDSLPVRVRVALALPNALLGAWQIGAAVQNALSALSATASQTGVVSEIWHGVLAYAVLLATTLAVVVADLTRTDASAREAVLRDGLTGLYDRRAWLERAATLRSKAARGSDTVLLAVFGIENLTSIVRREGQIAADRALVVLGQTLDGEFDRSRVVGRINGELLALLEWGSDPAAARIALDALRVRAETVATHELGFTLRVSMGTLECAPEIELAELLAEADQARLESERREWQDSVRADFTRAVMPAVRG